MDKWGGVEKESIMDGGYQAFDASLFIPSSLNLVTQDKRVWLLGSRRPGKWFMANAWQQHIANSLCDMFDKSPGTWTIRFPEEVRNGLDNEDGKGYDGMIMVTNRTFEVGVLGEVTDVPGTFNILMFDDTWDSKKGKQDNQGQVRHMFDVRYNSLGNNSDGATMIDKEDSKIEYADKFPPGYNEYDAPIVDPKQVKLRMQQREAMKRKGMKGDGGHTQTVIREYRKFVEKRDRAIENARRHGLAPPPYKPTPDLYKEIEKEEEERKRGVRHENVMDFIKPDTKKRGNNKKRAEVKGGEEMPEQTEEEKAQIKEADAMQQMEAVINVAMDINLKTFTYQWRVAPGLATPEQAVKLMRSDIKEWQRDFKADAGRAFTAKELEQGFGDLKVRWAKNPNQQEYWSERQDEVYRVHVEDSLYSGIMSLNLSSFFG